MLTMGWTLRRTRLMRRLWPGQTWSGGGVVVNKRKVDGGESTPSAGVVIPGQPQTGFYMAAHPTRWVLVVKDEVGSLHAVFVAPEVWSKHRIGDHITARNPLVDIR